MTTGKETVRHGKVVKKTAVDRFNDNRQDETRCLDAKRKMLHDEKMAAFRLRKRKYELRYGHSSSSSPAPVASGSQQMMFPQSAADKQILILRLQIQLAELTRGSDRSSSLSTPATNSFDLAANVNAFKSPVNDFDFTFAQAGTNPSETQTPADTVNWQEPSFNFS